MRTNGNHAVSAIGELSLQSGHGSGHKGIDLRFPEIRFNHLKQKVQK
jgi:hypothetical protein